MTGIKICGTGSYFPENVVDNEAFTAIVDTSDEWIRTRTGILKRHIADEDTTWSMGLKAARRALENANIAPEEVDLLITTTVTPDYMTPSTSCVIQGELGAVNASCFDINAACSGFVFALDMANRYMSVGDDYKTVLIVSTEVLSRMVDYTDRSTCVLFGDGAGAVVVRKGGSMFSCQTGTDGTGAALIVCKHTPITTPFSHKPPVENAISRNPVLPGYMTMDGKEVYKFATKMLPEVLEKACARAGITAADLDWIIPHQANIRIVQTAMKHLGLPMERAYMNINHAGNTSSASIPLALDEMNRAGLLKPGHKIGVVGFGGGLTYGGAVFEW